jgi:hypothetical protein
MGVRIKDLKLARQALYPLIYSASLKTKYFKGAGSVA